jgi:uncharacterized protein
MAALGHNPTETAIKGDDVSESTNLELVKRVYASFDDDDPGVLLEACDPDVEWLYPQVPGVPYGGAWTGPEGVMDFLQAHDAAEETLALEADDFIASGDRVVVLGRFRANARPAGREWSTDFVHEIVIAAGRIVRFKSCFDTAAAEAAHRA